MLELSETRVYRPFIGGKLMEEFSGYAKPKDGNFPERWICSTTSAGDDESIGISKTTDGKQLTEFVNKPLDILVKLLDSYTRLLLQVHPDDKLAQKYFGSPYGKTEAWYILGTREIKGEAPYVYLGFKKNVTREKWEKLFHKQDIKGMEACLHKIPVKKGDVFYIPAKLPHAMGSGVFFAEVQQPTDITLRTEKLSADGRKLSEFDLTHGASLEEMFDCFDYNGKTFEQTLRLYKKEKQGEKVLDSDLFSMYEINVEDRKTVKVQSYAIVIVLEGKNKGKEYYLDKDEEFIGKQKLLVCYEKN